MIRAALVIAGGGASFTLALLALGGVPLTPAVAVGVGVSWGLIGVAAALVLDVEEII